MRRLLTLFLVLTLAVTLGAALTAQGQESKNQSVNVSGNWTMTLDMSMGKATPALVLGQSGTTLTGTYTGRFGTSELKGTVKERIIQFSFVMGEDQTMSFTGEVAADGQAMKGTAVLGEMGDATWTATRNK